MSTVNLTSAIEVSVHLTDWVKVTADNYIAPSQRGSELCRELVSHIHLLNSSGMQQTPQITFCSQIEKLQHLPKVTRELERQKPSDYHPGCSPIDSGECNAIHGETSSQPCGPTSNFCIHGFYIHHPSRLSLMLQGDSSM